VQEFIFWTLNQARSQPNAPPPSPDLLPLAFFTIICAQWIIMYEYINTRLGQIEWEIELGLQALYAHDFDHTLKTLLTWRRRMPIYKAFIERTISRLSARYKSKEDTSPFDSWDDILTNLRDILHRIDNLHCRADKIMSVSMAVTAREESKKATQESHVITRINYLLFVFVPLSFLASFFGMSAEIPARMYRVYAAVALPISVCALGGLMFAGRIGCWWRMVREGKVSWNRGNKRYLGGV
jgi:Mg2+ and Co2+ transporter CorA